jgi:hypothetical protein
MSDPDVEFSKHFGAARKRASTMAPTLFVLAAEDLPFGKVLLEG